MQHVCKTNFSTAWSWSWSKLWRLLPKSGMCNILLLHELGNYHQLKLPGRDGSWMGDYASCGSCHLVHAARFMLHVAPRLLQRYNRRVSRTNLAGLLVYYIQARRSLSSQRTNFKYHQQGYTMYVYLHQTIQSIWTSTMSLHILCLKYTFRIQWVSSQSNTVQNIHYSILHEFDIIEISHNPTPNNLRK